MQDANPRTGRFFPDVRWVVEVGLLKTLSTEVHSKNRSRYVRFMSPSPKEGVMMGNVVDLY